MSRLIGTVLCLVLSLLPSLARPLTVRTYRELASACQNALPGDVITVAPGVYTITGASRIAIDNRPGPVTVRSATGKAGDVIIEGAGQDSETVQMCFDLTDSPRWTFENLTTRRTYYHGFKFNGSSTDCVVRNVVMRDHGEGGIKGTWRADAYPDRLRVEHCDIGFTQRTGGTRGVVEGIDGVAVRDWVVTGCRFVNVQKGGGPAYGVFTKGNAQNTVIENCRFENCFIGASFGGGGTGAAFFRDKDQSVEHRNGIIRNCVFVRCTDAGIYLNKARSAKIYGNTLFDCGLTIQLRYQETSADVASNLVCLSSAATDEPAVRTRDGATVLSNRANVITSASDFVLTRASDADVDVHLRANASARHKGVSLPDLKTDADKRPRPLIMPDAGAYQFVMVTAQNPASRSE